MINDEMLKFLEENKGEDIDVYEWNKTNNITLSLNNIKVIKKEKDIKIEDENKIDSYIVKTENIKEILGDEISLDIFYTNGTEVMLEKFW